MINLTTPGANFSRNRDFVAPVSGLTYMNYFGHGAEVLTRNLIAGNADATQFGSMSYGDGYAIFDGSSAYLRLADVQSSAMTMFGVFRTPTLNTSDVGFGAAYMTTWNSGSPAAGCMLIPRTDGIRGYAAGTGLVNLIEDIGGNETAWRFLALTVDNRVAGTLTIKVHDFTAGLTATETQAVDLEATSRVVQIGSSYQTTQMGDVHCACAGFAPAVISDTGLAALYANAQIVCPLAGVSGF